MTGKKKLNMLPKEVKNRYANRYIKYAVSLLSGICILVVAIQYIHIGILSFQINSIVKDNEIYQKEQETIKTLEEDIEQYKAFLTDYENKCFPLPLFMYDLEAKRPSDLYIISVDSADRLIHEGATEQDSETEEANKAEDEGSENKPETNPLPEIAYKHDLAGEEITIRGYSANQESLSNFIYDITRFPYIGSAKITGVEEHKIEGGVYNIFEIVVTGGAYN